MMDYRQAIKSDELIDTLRAENEGLKKKVFDAEYDLEGLRQQCVAENKAIRDKLEMLGIGVSIACLTTDPVNVKKAVKKLRTDLNSILEMFEALKNDD